jgi:hypothetical protein
LTHLRGAARDAAQQLAGEHVGRRGATDEVKRAQDTIRGSFFPAQKQKQQLCVAFAVLDPRV